ncbi:hypothetical protein [Lacticaseibacillus jixiensis]|uniref:hypothetical protein n=1 Tax=Lacticaseibacillus jixiensis TaxID=3231926 RepID=UPI0036F241A0
MDIRQDDIWAYLAQAASRLISRRSVSYFASTCHIIINTFDVAVSSVQLAPYNLHTIALYQASLHHHFIP